MPNTLIIGAGPTGLAAALFLCERGIVSRVVDEAIEPTPYSKAFGVNPRTLSLLEGTGVTERLLAQGRRMTALNVWRHGRRHFRLDLALVDHRYPFMLIHSQAETEALLADALTQRGVAVERGVAFEGVEMDLAGMRVKLRHRGGREETTSRKAGPKSTGRSDSQLSPRSCGNCRFSHQSCRPSPDRYGHSSSDSTMMWSCRDAITDHAPCAV